MHLCLPKALHGRDQSPSEARINGPQVGSDRFNLAFTYEARAAQRYPHRTRGAFCVLAGHEVMANMFPCTEMAFLRP
jgi:hypothetical protein